MSDPDTGLEKETIKAYGHRTSSNGDNVIFESEFVVPKGFGEVGAVLVENEHHKEMYFKDIVLKGLPYGDVHITCNSWVHSKYDNPSKRIFFTNKSYLPCSTPHGLRRLRNSEWEGLRGFGLEMRKKIDRIYDYDVYNDIGNPDKNFELARPVLGGKEFPYPRRCRTGRPHTKSDPLSESRSNNVYVPRDETFSEVKQMTFSATTVRSVVHSLLPQIECAMVDTHLGFPYFTAIDSLFSEGVPMETVKDVGIFKATLPRLVKAILDGEKDLLRFELPEMFNMGLASSSFRDRPTIARTNMPVEDPSPEEFSRFLEKPELELLKCFPSQIHATKWMAVLDVLSGHSPDEEYLGEHMEPAWKENPVIKAAFEKFSGRLKQLEGIIDERNGNLDLKNRSGAGVVPYELLKPSSEAGVTGRGVPYSISI